MFSCRAAWQRCGPLARRAAYRLPRDVIQRRPMSSVPGGSGENILYAVLCSGAFAGSLAYAYNTISTDAMRYNERIAELKARPKDEWVPKPWPPKSLDDEEEEEEEVVAVAEVEVEVEEEEATVAPVDAEPVVEEVAEEAAEAAEVAVEATEVQDVEPAAEEVVQVAEAVEEATQAEAEPAAVTAEEPESNGTTASEEAATVSEA